MTRADFIAKNRIEQVLEERGIRVHGSSAKCPLHEDKTASFSVNVREQVWKCHAGCGQGSVIDLLALLNNTSAVDYIKAQGITADTNGHHRPVPLAKQEQKFKQEKVYSYRDATGKEVFQVVRYTPKTFRQRRANGPGWIWGMEGVERMLYRLPEVLAADTVALVEGEKDADSLALLGWCGTCNVGGADKWLDAYTDTLKGKDVLIFGDNDEPGRKHVETVFNSIAGRVRSAKLIKIPMPDKDVSDYIKRFDTPEKAKDAIQALVNVASPHINGIRLPLFSMSDLEPMYREHVRNLETDSFDLGKWLPSLRRLRALVPGDLVMFVGNTGIGKTAMLSSLCLACALPRLFFQLELPQEVMFERLLAAKNKMDCREVEAAYKVGDEVGPKALDHHFHNLLISCEPRLSPERLEDIITRSELKLGQKPKLVLIDYVQLAAGRGDSRYDRATDVAEGLKVLAKATRTIVVIASQVSRPAGEDPEVGLHDAKESGALENSCGLVCGAWRDPKDTTLMHLKVLKANRGGAGLSVKCNFDGPRMMISEREDKT